MFKRNSGFTLIELIVVIAVLGILAAIIIPNISNFTGKAKEVRFDADVRNLQTAVDMYRVESQTGVDEPVADVFVSAESGAVVGKVIDTDELVPSHLRKAPSYLKNGKLLDTVGASADYAAFADAADLGTFYGDGEVDLDLDKGEVVAVIEYQLEDAGNPASAKSTSIVRYLSADATGSKVVR